MKTDELLKNAGAAGAKAGLELNTAIGDRDLCAWRPVRGIWWVQTRNPRHAARLAKRKDGRLVATGVAGGFLRTFEFAKPSAWGWAAAGALHRRRNWYGRGISGLNLPQVQF